MRITYDGIEPFGGFKLHEDTQEFGWNELKRNFLKVNRRPGVYMYHKHSGGPSFMLFNVQPNGKAFPLIPPKIGNDIFIVYSNTMNFDDETLTALAFEKELRRGMNNGITACKDLYDDMKKTMGAAQRSIYSYITTATKTQRDNDIRRFIEKLSTITKQDVDWYRKEYEMKIDPGYSEHLSNDIGIISPNRQNTGTYMAFFTNPNLDKLVNGLGYSEGATEMTPTSEDTNYDKYLSERRLKGKVMHDFIDDTAEAIDSSKAHKIGWASNVQDL
jgi:hypothetical protein